MSNPGAASTVTDNLTALQGVRLTPAQLASPSAALISNQFVTYQTDDGRFWKSNGTALVQIEKPQTSEVIATRTGTIAAPYATFTALSQGKFAMGEDVKISAADVPSNGLLLRISAVIAKVGADSGFPTIWIGPTNGPADFAVATATFSATNPLQTTITALVSVNASGFSAPATWATPNVGNANASIADLGAWDGNDFWISSGVTGAGTATTYNLVNMVVEKVYQAPLVSQVVNVLTAPLRIVPDFFGLNATTWPVSGTPPIFPVGRLSTFDNVNTHWRSLQSAINTITWATMDTFVTNARAAGIQKGTYVPYGCPTAIASTGAAVAGPYGGLGEGAFPNNLPWLTYFCQQFALRNSTVWGGFFDTVQLFNEPDFNTTPSASSFWWGTAAQYVDMLWTAYTALKTANPLLTVLCPGTYLITSGLNGMDQWINQTGTTFSTIRGYNCFDGIASHPYHSRPPVSYSGYGDILSIQGSGRRNLTKFLSTYNKLATPFHVTEYGVSSASDAELTNFNSTQTAAYRATFMERLEAWALLNGVQNHCLWSLGNALNLSGNLTETNGTPLGRTRLYNGTVNKTAVAPSGYNPVTGQISFTFSDGTTYTTQ